MAKHLLVRHGECVANVENVFAGQKNDSPLTEKGYQQAREAARNLNGKNVSRIIASPLARTKQSAETIAEEIGFPKENIEYEPRIMEYDMGAITSQPRHAITSMELISAEGAEDVERFLERICGGIIENAKNSDNEVILFVTHAGVARMISCALSGKKLHDFYEVPALANAEVIELDIEAIDNVKNMAVRHSKDTEGRV